MQDRETINLKEDATQAPTIEGRWNKGTITGTSMVWKNGKTTIIKMTDATTAEMTLHGKEYRGVLRSDGTLHWNDGDVWTKNFFDLEAQEEKLQPEEKLEEKLQLEEKAREDPQERLEEKIRKEIQERLEAEVRKEVEEKVSKETLERSEAEERVWKDIVCRHLWGNNRLEEMDAMKMKLAISDKMEKQMKRMEALERKMERAQKRLTNEHNMRIDAEYRLEEKERKLNQANVARAEAESKQKRSEDALVSEKQRSEGLLRRHEKFLDRQF